MTATSISFKSTRGAQPTRRLDALEDSITQLVDGIKRVFYRGGWFTTGIVAKTKTVARPWEVLLCDPTAGALTVILPDPTNPVASGTFIAVKNDSNSVNNITVQPLRGTVDGATTYVFAVARRNVVFWSDGKEWKEWSIS